MLSSCSSLHLQENNTLILNWKKWWMWCLHLYANFWIELTIGQAVKSIRHYLDITTAFSFPFKQSHYVFLNLNLTHCLIFLANVVGLESWTLVCPRLNICGRDDSLSYPVVTLYYETAKLLWACYESHVIFKPVSRKWRNLVWKILKRNKDRWMTMNAAVRNLCLSFLVFIFDLTNPHKVHFVIPSAQI